MDELVAHHGVRRALCAADLEAAHKAGQPAIIADVEGLDFLDKKLERLEEAHRRSIRLCSSCITRRTTSATSRPAQSGIRVSVNSAPR
jgi:microsomal dipeptidase-like Zn-dependent dipeptidase